jgi:hypothetical protein
LNGGSSSGRVFQGISGFTGWKRVNLPGVERRKREDTQPDNGWKMVKRRLVTIAPAIVEAMCLWWCIMLQITGWNRPT